MALKRIEEKIAKWSTRLSLIGLIGLLCLSVITVGAVLLRAVFGISILGIYDASELIVVVIVTACFPLTSVERAHINVSVLGTAIGGRTRHLFDAFSALISLVFFTFLTVQLWKYALELMGTHESTWIVHIPLYPWWLAAAVLITLCIPIELVCFFSAVGAAVKFEPENQKPLQS